MVAGFSIMTQALLYSLWKYICFFLFWDHHLLISKYCGNCKSSDTYILLFYSIWALKLTSITSLFHPIAHIHTALLFSIQTVSICGKKRKKKEGCIPVYQSFTWTEDSGINPSTWATVFRFHLGLRLWYLCDHFHILFLFAPSTDQFSSWKSIMFFIH